MFNLMRVIVSSIRLTVNTIFFPVIGIALIMFIKIFEDIIRIFKTGYNFPLIGEFLNKMFNDNIWKGFQSINMDVMMDTYKYLAISIFLVSFLLFFCGGINIIVKMLRAGTDVRDFLKKEKEAQEIVLKIINTIDEKYFTKTGKNISKKFKVKLIDSKVKNAVIFSDNLIVITTELVFNSSNSVLTGVIAHEVGHFINGDTTYNQLNLLNGIVSNNIHGGFLNNFMVSIVFAFNKVPFIGPFLFILLFVLFLPILICIFIYSVINLFVSVAEGIINRKQEFNADKFAAYIDCGDGLVEFLYEDLYQQENFHQITSLKEMNKAAYRSMFLTHPASHKRIKKLEALL